MHIDDEIRFEGALPTPESILREIMNISGLRDLTWNDRKTKLRHPDFTKLEFFLYREEHAIHIGRGWEEKWYLLDSTIAALINLGGKYSGHLSEFGNKSWDEVKDKYPNFE